MTKKILGFTGALVLMLAGAAPSLAAPQRTVEASDNVKLVAHFPYVNEDANFFQGGTDIDFSGRYVYAMQQGANGGVHVIDHAAAKPKKVAFIPCPGEQNDVAVVKPGLIAIGFHSSTCAGVVGGGILLADVKDPKKPKFLGNVTFPGGTHTLTVYPGKDIIYSSPDGLGNVRGAEQIIDVSNPTKPKIAATFNNTGTACHDVTFHISKDRKLGFCPGSTNTEIWDASDPLAPVVIARIFNPLQQYQHDAAVTSDGNLLVIGDEAVVGNDCVGGPTGAMYAYDISDPTTPIPQGYFAIPRGQQPAGSSNVDRNTWCTAHIFKFIPGTYTMVASWYSAGMDVIDWTNPSTPAEIAHYMGTGEDITNYWSAYWYDGRIYANDRVKGLDVFTVKGLKEGK